MKTCSPYRLALVLLMAVTASASWADEAEDQYRVAAGHYTQQRWTAALREFEVLLRQFPDHPLSQTVPFFQGESFHQLHRYQDAHRHYEKYMLRQPHGKYRNHALFRTGECSTLLGNYTDGLGELSQFLRDFPRDPLRGHAQLYRGQCLLGLQQAKQATEAYLQALDQLLKDHAPDSLVDKCRFGLAQALDAAGEPAQANRFYQFIASGDGRMADEALVRMIHNAFDLKRFDEAVAQIEDLRQRFSQSPQRTRVEWLAAQIHMQRNEHKLAAELLIDVIDETTEADPGAEMLFDAARAFHVSGDNRRADRCFEQIVRRWPTSPRADDAAYARVLLASQNSAAGASHELRLAGQEDSIDRCRDFIAKYPHSEFLQATQEILSETLLQTARFEEAAKGLEAIYRQHGGARIGYLLLLSHLGAEQFEQAIAVGRSLDVEALDVGFRPGLLLAHASALMKTAQYVEASEVLQRCWRILPAAEHTNASEAAIQCATQRAIALAHVSQIEEAMEMLSYVPIESPSRVTTMRFVAAKAREIGATAESAILYEQLANSGAELSVNDLSSLAAVLLQTGDMDRYELRVAEAKRRFPNEHQTHQLTLQYGQTLERAGKLAAAYDCYLWLAENAWGKPGRAGAFLAARLDDRAGRDQHAIELLQPLRQTQGEGAPADAVLYHLAWALLDLGRESEALEAFRELADVPGRNPLVIDAIYRAAKLEAARGELQLAAQRLDAAIEESAELPAHPNSTNAGRLHLQMLRSQIAGAQREWAVAESHLRPVATAQGARPALLRDAWFHLGESQYRQRKFKEAATSFGEADKLIDPAKPPRWRALLQLREAQLLAHNKQWREAGKRAQAVLAQHPNFTHRHEAAYLLGRAHAARARFSDARNAYQQVLKAPAARGTVTAAKAQWMIGETHFHQRQYEQAIRAYHRVELLHQHKTWQALALLQAAKCHARLGQNQESIEMLQEVVRRFPNSRAAKEAAAEQRKVTTTADNRQGGVG